MSRRTVQFAAVATAALSVPAPAYAETAASVDAVNLTVSLVGLVVAVFLLYEALTVRKVAMGGAIADKISYVILATVCLAASALAQWAQNFLAGLTAAQLQLASQVLVIVAMALLATYFLSVRRTLQAYMKAMTGTEMLDAEKLDESEEAERG